MPTFRDGQVNLFGITNPGVYVDIVPQNPLINGLPSNVEGLVGVASWGPVGSPMVFSDPTSCANIFGFAQIRPYDMPSHVLAASTQGQVIAYAGVRVTDGTDTAASVAIPTNLGVMTARYTGSMGNTAGIAFQPGGVAGAYSAVVSLGTTNPEIFTNIIGALASMTLTAGTGYTSVPSLALSAPQALGGIQAVATGNLTATGVPTVAAGGSGYVVADRLTLANGLVLQVATVTSGAVVTVTVVTPGIIYSGASPIGAQAVASTTGAGVGATFTLTWVLGAANIVEAGFGYTSMTCSLIGGGGSGGSYAPITSFSAALTRVINKGSNQSSASKRVVYTQGTGTGSPTPGVITYMTGGTDGASGVSTAQMLGSDTLPRKGMYALRSSGCDCFALCDLTDITSFAAQLSFGQSEQMMAVIVTAMGDTIAGSVASRLQSGVNDWGLWWLQGDWPQFYDTTNGIVRFVSPQAFALGLAGNLSPEQSPINKPLVGVVATQTSSLGLITSSADNGVAQNGGIDFIGRSADLGESYFSFITGNNAYNLVPSNRVEYTRLTYWLSRELSGFAAKSIVGKLQSVQPNDPTRTRAKMMVDSFLQLLRDPQFGSGGYGIIDQFQTTCDLTNNPPTSQALGFLFLYAAIRYLNAVRYFVIQMQGGGNVTITSQSTIPTQGQLSSIVANLGN
jgi:hypothetical protein